jgi:hypothetical protein
MQRCRALGQSGLFRFTFTPTSARALRRPERCTRSLWLALLSLALASVAAASERAIVRLACPLDGTTFEAVQDFSGYAEGQRLDLKKLGPISQPPALARCPQCGLPIFAKHLAPTEAERIRAIVASARFRTEALPATPWFALAILREELRAEPFEIGWTYLHATWEAEERDTDNEAYARAARRALAWFDRAAPPLRDLPERRKEYLLALYLPIELARRTGDFADARRRLDALPDLKNDAPNWLPSAIEAQARLIAARDAAPDDGRLPPLPPPGAPP